MEVMMRITREDVANVIGGTDDVTIADSSEQAKLQTNVAEAMAWIANGELLTNGG
jgi:hypothetical protein